MSPKRLGDIDVQAEAHLDPLVDEPSHEDIIAKDLAQRQNDKQKRRRTVARGRGWSTGSSLWSTLAASIGNNRGHFSFVCEVCNAARAMNGNVSTSNIVKHYQRTHPSLYRQLVAVNDANATESNMQARIEKEKKEILPCKQNTTLHCFFPQRLQQIILPLPTTLFEVFRIYPAGLVDIFRGRAQFSSKEQADKVLVDTHTAFCHILRRSATNAKIGSITVDGWSAALGTPILGMMWHYIDSDWKLRCVPIATLNMSTAVKSGNQIRCVIEEVLEQNPIVWSDDIRVYTATSDNEAATALAVDLLTNFVGSVRCVVHTLALAVNDVFEEGSAWKKYMEHVNKVTSYFNYHPKATQLLSLKQLDEGITADRVQRLKHDIPTRWHSRLAAMSGYLCRINTIGAVVQELNISPEAVPTLSTEQQDVLAEFISVLSEVRRVARQLEADRKVTMSRAQRLLRELYETLIIMGGDMLLSASATNPTLPGALFLGEEDTGLDIRALPTRASSAEADEKSDEASLIRLRKAHSKALAIKLADHISRRFENVWEQVDVEAAVWAPMDSDATEPDRDIHRPRRALLFHLAAVLDVNQFNLDFLETNASEKGAYTKLLHRAVVREAAELDSLLTASSHELEIVFGLFHKGMRDTLSTTGRKESSVALSFRNYKNNGSALINPVAFNTVARAALLAQDSSTAVEGFLSDLGCTGGN